MKLKAIIIVNGEYTGNSKNLKEILQGYEEFLSARINLLDYEIKMEVIDGN